MFPSFSIQKGSSAPPGTTQDITVKSPEETATVNNVKMAAKDSWEASASAHRSSISFRTTTVDNRMQADRKQKIFEDCHFNYPAGICSASFFQSQNINKSCVSASPYKWEEGDGRIKLYDYPSARFRFFFFFFHQSRKQQTHSRASWWWNLGPRGSQDPLSVVLVTRLEAAWERMMNRCPGITATSVSLPRPKVDSPYHNGIRHLPRNRQEGEGVYKTCAGYSSCGCCSERKTGDQTWWRIRGHRPVVTHGEMG